MRHSIHKRKRGLLSRRRHHGKLSMGARIFGALLLGALFKFKEALSGHRGHHGHHNHHNHHNHHDHHDHGDHGHHDHGHGHHH